MNLMPSVINNKPLNHLETQIYHCSVMTQRQPQTRLLLSSSSSLLEAGLFSWSAAGLYPQLNSLPATPAAKLTT